MVRSQFRLGNSTGRRGRAGSFIPTAPSPALLIARVALAFGLALVLIPIVAVGPLIATRRLRALRVALRGRLTASGRRRDHDEPRTTETDHTVIEASDRKTP